jgi:hypothetical protein
LIDVIKKGENNIYLMNIDFDFYINVLKRQYSKYELVLFYLFILSGNYGKYHEFFEDNYFFADLKFSTVYPLERDIIDRCGIKQLKDITHAQLIEYLVKK